MGQSFHTPRGLLGLRGTKPSTDFDQSESNENDNETQIPEKLNQTGTDLPLIFQELRTGAP
jgi:hypothetical protein